MLFHSDEVYVGIEPQALHEFVDALVRDANYDGPERRTEPRHRVIVPVAVIPATSDGQPAGDAFRALTRDISASGVGLLSLRDVDAPFLMVQFVTPSRGTYTTLVEVTRTGVLDPLFEIAGRFVVATG